MKVFISGGCKNGKSMYAQNLAKEIADEKDVPLYYIATMIPHDEEDDQRIKRHIADRDGWGFQTIEVGKNIKELADENNDIDKTGVFLLDSVTALLANEMFLDDGSCDFRAGGKVTGDLGILMDSLDNIVFVSDYIYSDGRVLDSFTENYREALALVDKSLAAGCDQVVEVAYGHKYFFK